MSASSSEASGVNWGRGGRESGGGVVALDADTERPAKTPAKAAAGPKAAGLLGSGGTLRGGSGGLSGSRASTRAGAREGRAGGGVSVPSSLSPSSRSM